MDASGVIKISDFGMAEDIYSQNYFRQVPGGGVKLPLKWMAPESIKLGVFTEKTDMVKHVAVVCTNLSLKKQHISCTILCMHVMLHQSTIFHQQTVNWQKNIKNIALILGLSTRLSNQVECAFSQNLQIWTINIQYLIL